MYSYSVQLHDTGSCAALNHMIRVAKPDSYKVEA